MRDMRRNAVKTAVSLAAMSGCGALSTGRCISAFYAQTGGASWLGIAVGCILYGLMIGGAVRLKRRTGAGGLAEVYAGIFGKTAGAVFTALHAAFFTIAAYALLGAAAETASLLLPVHHADAIGIAAAIVTAFFISRVSSSVIKACGGVCFTALAALMLALMARGKMPGRETLNFYVRLKLNNNIPAAVLLAAVHASLAGALCAAPAVRLYQPYVKPHFAGCASAAAMAALLMLGNAVFAAFPPEINALRYPFAALSGGWGRAGYYFCGLARYAEIIISL